MIKPISIVISIFCFFSASAQFEKATINTSHIVTHINDNGDILHGIRTADQDIVLTKFDIRGNLQWSKRLLPFVDNGNARDLRFRWSNELLENGEFIFTGIIDQPDPKVIFSKLNAQGEVAFTKIIRYPSNFIPDYQFGSEKIPKIIVYDDNSSLIMNYFLNEDESYYYYYYYYYYFVKFDSEGNILWHKEFKDLLPETQSPILYINKIGTDQTVIIRDGFYGNHTDIDEVDNILFLDKNFDKLKSLKIERIIQKIIFADGRYYIILWAGGINDSVLGLTVQLICLDTNLNVLWAKEYFNPTGSSSRHTFSETSYGFLISEYVDIFTNMNLIAINFDGDIMSSKKIASNKLASFFPDVSDTHFILESKFEEDGVRQIQLTCAENTLDELECYAPNTCYTAFDFEPTINEVNNFFIEEVNLSIEVSDTIMKTEDYIPDYFDYCTEDFGDCPVSIFEIPDTVCINENISVSNLQNDNAELVIWLLPSSSIEISNALSPIPFSYPNAGTFTITQQVTYEGCTDEYSKEIAVIAPIDLAVETDIILCDQDPYLIDANHELILAHLWQDSSTNSTLLTEDEGIYNLQITDQYCTQSIDFNLTYFDYDKIDPNFPEDTLICSQIALSLGDSISPAVSTLWDDGSSAYPRLVSNENLYTLTTSLDGCSTQSSIFIETEDCSTKVFMPNIFSPNKDGINDLIYPLGDSFLILQFTVHDRWGSLIHDEASPWDGTFRNEDANMGVYLYTINLLNLRLNTNEKFSGNFTLVR